MKILKASFFSIILATNCFAGYKTIDEALKNGISRGDAIFYGNYLSLQSGSSGFVSNNKIGEQKFLGNTGYFQGSVGLGYTSGFYYNIRAAISFRAAQNFYNARDANRDFNPSALIDLADSFLEYYDGDTAIKAGRFMPSNEWINHLIDGVWIRNASLRNLLLEGIWAYEYGRVSFFEMSEFKKIPNKGNGYFNVGAKYYMSKNQSDYKNSSYLQIFSLFAPNIFSSIGGRAHLAYRFNNTNIWLGLDGGGAFSFEDKTSIYSFKRNTGELDIRGHFGFSAASFSVGYILTGQSGFGSLGSLGIGVNNTINPKKSHEDIIPFFVWGGRAIRYMPNAQLLYGSVLLNVFDDKLVSYLSYGVTFFGDNKLFTQNELNFALSVFVTNTISAILFVTNSHLGSGIQNYTQVNGGIRLSF